MNNVISQLIKQGATSLSGQPLFDRIIDVALFHIAPKRANDMNLQTDWLTKTDIGGMLRKGLDSSKIMDQFIMPNLFNGRSGYDNPFRIDIKCTDSGVKPAITASVKMLPFSMFYDMEVQIQNFALRSDIDIRKFNVMTVTIGYRNGGTQLFTGPIFSSYQTTPNPDGITVFKGTTVGEIGLALAQTVPYTLRFYKDTVSIDELCRKVAQSLGLKYTPFASDKIKYSTLHVRKITVNTSNALALQNWLQNLVYQWGQSRTKTLAYASSEYPEKHTITEPDPISVYTIVRDGQLFLIQENFTEEQLDREEVIFLENVTSPPSLAGPLLSVRALYNPKLQPGMLIYMPPIYFGGGNTIPNQIDSTVYDASQHIYRVIKMEVSFSTVGSENTMAIQAVPMQDFPEDPAQNTDLATATEVLMKMRDNQADKGTNLIEFGSPESPEAEDVLPADVWSLPYTPEGSPVLVDTILLNGNKIGSVSEAAQAAWQSPDGSSPLFILPKDKMPADFVPAKKKGVPLYCFYPLIILDTYKRMLQDPKTYKVDISNPDTIFDGYELSIPAMSVDKAKSFIGNQTYVAIFKYFRDFYTETNHPWKDFMSDIYMYLSKGRP